VTSDRNASQGAGGTTGGHGMHQPPREEPKKIILRGEPANDTASVGRNACLRTAFH
jgi:hypothetical protein